jgi:tricarballylate dehydrogenase
MRIETFDIIVVGGGNAGFSAALSAKEAAGPNTRVLIIDKAPENWAGGNSYFTAGATRMTYAGLNDLIPLLDDQNDERIKITDVDPYTPEDFIADMRRVTLNRCNPELTRILAYECAEAVHWLKGKGLRYRLMYDRQSFFVEGRHRFFGNLVIGVVDGGKGMIAQYHEIAQHLGIEVRHGTGIADLLRSGSGEIAGIIAQSTRHYTRTRLEAPAVSLAAGGFESDTRRRNANLGPGWDLAKVRGTPFNTGEAIDIALAHGAAPAGHWSGAHSVSWDANAPSEHGDREISNRFTKQSYPIGLMVNIEGHRFVDEGADFRNYTYAKYGAEVLRQPGSLAFHVFDSKTEPILRLDEYRAPGVTRFEAETLDDLATQTGLPRQTFVSMINEFNDNW